MRNGFKVIKGGIKFSDDGITRHFISGYATSTRLMGVIGMDLQWEFISDKFSGLLNQIFYLDAEEYGLESYTEAFGRNPDVIRIERSRLVSSLGGKRVKINEAEARFLLQTYVGTNKRFKQELPEGYDGYKFMLSPVQKLTRDEYYLLFRRISGLKESPNYVINYYLMRTFANDYRGVDFLTAHDTHIYIKDETLSANAAQNINIESTHAQNTGIFLESPITDSSDAEQKPDAAEIPPSEYENDSRNFTNIADIKEDISWDIANDASYNSATESISPSWTATYSTTLDSSAAINSTTDSNANSNPATSSFTESSFTIDGTADDNSIVDSTADSNSASDNFANSNLAADDYADNNLAADSPAVRKLAACSFTTSKPTADDIAAKKIAADESYLSDTELIGPDYFPKGPFSNIHTNSSPAALCQNTIERASGPIRNRYLCESLVEYNNSYRIVTSEIILAPNPMRVISAKKCSSFKITSAEVALILNSHEYIAVLDISSDDIGFLDAFHEFVESFTESEYECGKLYIDFFSTNAHVGMSEYRMNADVRTIYFLSDFNQLIIASYSAERTHEAIVQLTHEMIPHYMALRSKFDFAFPVLYEFLRSGMEDFFEFLSVFFED